jgi:alpha-amylase
VFWQDYYTWGLALAGEVSGIDALVRAHEAYAGGDTQVLYVDDDLYIMQRLGWQMQRGLVYVLNNRASWNGAAVRTRWSNTAFSPVAWRGEDLGQPLPKQTGTDGVADFWALPRGYVVYAPQ